MLAGHRVLITGGARGLGESFARAVYAAGASLAITDIDAPRGQALATELGERACFVEIDVSNAASIAAGVVQATEFLGGLDGLVNNAAVTNSGGKFLHELEEAMWDMVMSVNIKGVWLMTKACTEALRQSGRGRVVNLSSDTSLWGAPKLLAYVASKGAINAMTHSMARELGEFGITVNAIAPGLVVGESTQYVPQARHDFYLQGRAIPRQQLPEDLNAALLFLLSEPAGFVTGQVLPVNGGFVMQ